MQVYWLQFGRYFARGPIVSSLLLNLYQSLVGDDKSKSKLSLLQVVLNDLLNCPGER